MEFIDLADVPERDMVLLKAMESKDVLRVAAEAIDIQELLPGSAYDGFSGYHRVAALFSGIERSRPSRSLHARKRAFGIW